MLLAFPLISNATMQEETVLTNFLEAVKSEDIESALEYLEDNRYSSQDELEKDYSYLLKQDRLSSYHIENSELESNGVYNYTVKAHFSNGGISIIPFTVMNNKVHITLDSLENMDYEVLNIGAETPQITPMHTLCNWNFVGRGHGSTFYSGCSFDVTKSQLTMLVTQKTSDGQSPSITYSVVKKHWYGDDVWGSRVVTGTKSSAYTTTISGKSSSFKGAQMRFKTKSHASKPTSYEGIGTIAN